MSFSSYFRKFSQFAQAQQKLSLLALFMFYRFVPIQIRLTKLILAVTILCLGIIIVGGLNVLSYNKKHRIVDFEIQTWYYNILNQKINSILSLYSFTMTSNRLLPPLL